MTTDAPKPVAKSVVLDLCAALGYDPNEVAEIECVLLEPRAVTVTVRPSEDRRALVTYQHPVE